MKKLLSLALTICLLLTVPIIASAADQVSIEIDGQAVQYTQKMGMPYVDNASRTQVPLNLTMTEYGATVAWDGVNNQAVVTKDNTTVQVPIGQKYIIVDGTKQATDTAALIKNGRTYLPIAHVLRAFGATVEWDSNNNRVLVYSNGRSNVKVHFINVGQADAILIDVGEYEVLIDAGNNGDGTKVVNYIKPYVDGALDLIIATHPDADHIGGLDDVLAAYQVSRVIDSGEVKTTATYTDYYAAATSEANCKFTVDANETIDLGNGVSLEIIETGDGYSDSNDNSVVSLLKYGKVSVLLTGDMEAKSEAASLSKFSDVDVLKAGHHGSKTSSSEAFLNITKPETVIVSAGTGNTYKHPHLAALQRFNKIGAKVYGTQKSGDIVLTTNGSTYSVNTTSQLTLTDVGDYAEGGAQTTPPGTTAPGTQPGAGTVTKAEAAFVGNSNTHKYHKLTCRYADQISAENIIYFKAKADAHGYDACKVCKP